MEQCCKGQVCIKDFLKTLKQPYTMFAISCLGNFYIGRRASAGDLFYDFCLQCSKVKATFRCNTGPMWGKYSHVIAINHTPRPSIPTPTRLTLMKARGMKRIGPQNFAARDKRGKTLSLWILYILWHPHTLNKVILWFFGCVKRWGVWYRYNNSAVHPHRWYSKSYLDYNQIHFPIVMQ